ncbi:MAG: hypothetical protein WD063_20385 [Pirellulales bacterium]
MKTPLRSLVMALAMAALAAPGAFAQDEFELTPLDGVIVDMQVAGGRLAKTLTDSPTQQKQQDAIDKLDALIKIFEQRRQQMGGRAGANPDKPLEDSIVKAGPGGTGALHDPNRQGRGWGQLPAHKREEILQSMTEGFPPHYQQLLERYFRGLAEERPRGEPSDEEPAAAPAAQGDRAEKPSAE